MICHHYDHDIHGMDLSMFLTHAWISPDRSCVCDGSTCTYHNTRVPYTENTLSQAALADL